MTALVITLWPLAPTGNFFNNWLSIIYFLPLGFIIYFLIKKKINMSDIIKLYKILTSFQKKYLMLLVFLMLIGMFFEIFGISLIIPLITILVSDDFQILHILNT